MAEMDHLDGNYILWLFLLTMVESTKLMVDVLFCFYLGISTVSYFCFFFPTTFSLLHLMGIKIKAPKEE